MADPQHRQVLAGELGITVYLQRQQGESDETGFGRCERLLAPLIDENDKHRHVAGRVLAYMRTDDLYLRMDWTEQRMKEE